MDSLVFYYNGIKSSDLGVYLVNLDSGLKTTRFLPEKEIISEKIVGNPIPYVYGQDSQPLSFTLTLACLEEKWTLEKRRQVARWLDVSTFEEFYTEDEPEKRYYFQYQGGIDFTHNTLGDGYIQVEMLNISPFAYSPFYEDRFYLLDNTTPAIIEFENNGDDIVKPEIWIRKVGKGDIQIKNLSNSGKEFKFTQLEDDETVYVDNNLRHIETDLSLTYRHDNFNGTYLELVRGINRLEVTGTCQLLLRYQYTIKG